MKVTKYCINHLCATYAQAYAVAGTAVWGREEMAEEDSVTARWTADNLAQRCGARLGDPDCNVYAIAGRGRVFRKRPPTDL